MTTMASPDSIAEESSTMCSSLRPVSQCTTALESRASPVDFTPRKTGEHEADMHEFIQNSLLNLLRPMSQHVRDLSAQVTEMNRTFVFNTNQIAENIRRLDVHEKQASTMGSDYTAMHKSQCNVKASLKVLLDEKDKADRDYYRTQAEHKTAQEMLQAVMNDAQLLKDQHHEMLPQVQQLQASSMDCHTFTLQLHADLVAAKISQENLLHNHLGMSERLEQTKSLGEATSKDLGEYCHTNSHQYQETQACLEKHNKRWQRLDTRLDETRAAQHEHRKQLASMKSDIGSFYETLGIVQQNLADTENHDNAAEVAEIQKKMKEMDVRSSLTSLFQKVGAIENNVETLSDNLNEQVQPRLESVSNLADANAQVIAEHGSELYRLDGSMKENKDLLQKTCISLGEDEKLIENLSTARDVLESDVRCLSIFQSKASETMDAHGQDIDRLRMLLSASRKDLDATSSSLMDLSGDFSLTHDMVVKNSSRLDVAHDYFSGLGKGIVDVHKSIQAGQDGMLMPKPCSSMVLPVLPGVKRPGSRAVVGREAAPSVMSVPEKHPV